MATTTSTLAFSLPQLSKVHFQSCKSQKRDDGGILANVRDAYNRLSHEQLVLFLSIRSLPTSGCDAELAELLGSDGNGNWSKRSCKPVPGGSWGASGIEFNSVFVIGSELNT